MKQPSRSAGALTVNFTINGTATFNTDYTQTGATTFTPPNGTVDFAAGSSTATVTVDPTADTTVEPDETAILTVAQGTGSTSAPQARQLARSPTTTPMSRSPLLRCQWLKTALRIWSTPSRETVSLPAP